MATDIVQLANAKASEGKAADAAALLEQAGAAGNLDASAELGLWLLRGDLIPRDVPRARMFLGQAAEGGNEEAILLEIALSANGSGGATDWGAALHLLKRNAPHYDYLGRELALIERLDLDSNGHPQQPIAGTVIDKRVRMIRYPAFLSSAECQHLANISVRSLRPSTVFDPATGRQIANPIRSSEGTVIGPAQEDLIVQAICRRIAKATETDFAQGEPISILRYGPGQEYRPHFDAIPSAGNNRIKTVLMYLNDSYSGGETDFPELGVVVQPKAGDALVFDGLEEDGSTLILSRHAGLPILSGQKWVATRWIRERRYDPWAAGSHEQ